MTLIRSGCPLCSTPNVACGGHPSVNPVDIHDLTSEAAVYLEPPKLALYEYELNGMTTQGQLTEAHAKRLKARPLATTTEQAAPAPAPTEEKSTTARSKVRRTAPDK